MRLSALTEKLSGESQKNTSFGRVKRIVETASPLTSEQAQKRNEQDIEKYSLRPSDYVADAAKAISRRIGIKQAEIGKVLGFWIKHVPYQFRADICGDMVVKLLEVKAPNAKYAFMVCRNLVIDWHRKQHHRDHASLDAISDSSGDSAVDALVGFCQYDNLVESEAIGIIEAEKLYRQIPKPVQLILDKRINGKAPTATERKQLNRWMHSKGISMLIESAN